MVARTLPYPLHSLLLWFVLQNAFTQNRFTKPFPFLQATPYLFSKPSILREDLSSNHPVQAHKENVSTVFAFV